MKIEIDDLSRPAIHALLNEHLQSMYELSPPESVHALDDEHPQARDHVLVRLGRLAPPGAVPSKNWIASTAR